MSTSDVRTVTFQNLIDEGLLEIGDGYRAKNEELGGVGPLFLRAGHVTDTHIDFAGVERFHESLTEKLRPKMALAGDTVVTTKGNSTGRTSFVTTQMPEFVYSPHLSYWRTRDESKLASGFLRYWSRSWEFTRQLLGMKASTDMAPYLSLTDQRRLKITLLPSNDQQAIAHILGTLDDKIELNRRRNRTLEGLARAIFQSWFVDFDPVKAKAAGRTPPGLSPELAALFPDSFEQSELGEIPKGWRVGTVGDVAEIVGGSTPSTKQPSYWDDGVHHWATPKDLSNLANPVLLHTDRMITDAGLEKISSGLLPVGTVLLSSRAPIGYLAINQVPVAINQGFIAMKPKNGVPAQFLLRWTEVSHDDIVSRANGSTFLEISKKNFRPIQLVIPDDKTLAAFDRHCRPLFEQVVNNESESCTLSALRGALLPKLISGELRVPETERIVGRTV